MPYSPIRTDHSSNDTITKPFLFPQTKGSDPWVVVDTASCEGDIGVPCPVEVVV